MRVTGIEKLEFGVDNLSHCAKFMCDFGLTRDASGQKFTTLSGARLELNPIDSPDLPPAFEAGNTLRRMTWGVADRAALEALPGVGRKTANVVLNTAFGWPTIAVDTHIFRVCNRTQFAPGKNVEQVEEKLLKVVPAEFKVDCHHWLILHGRYTCIARKPRCGSCLIEDLCEYKEKVES